MPMAQILLQTVWLIPCYPLIGAVLSMLWFPAVTRRTGPRPSGYVNAIFTFFAFVHGVIALTAIWNQPAQQQFIPWLNVAGESQEAFEPDSALTPQRKLQVLRAAFLPWDLNRVAVVCRLLASTLG